MSEIEALGYVGISVSNMDAWTKFAGEVLGLQVVSRDDGAVDLRMDAHATRLRLIPDGHDDLVYAGWEVKDAKALHGLAARLTGLGIGVEFGSPEQAANRYVKEFIRFTDPEGLALEAYYGALQRTDKPFLSPVGAKFKTGRQGIGHIVVVAQDAQAQERFYADVLGFRLSDYIHTEVVPGRPLNVTFMRCNSRHHSLALVAIPLKKKLQHLMLEVQSVDDVGRALYRAIDSKTHISLTLGRHSNDDMLSFYPMSPSGFDIEYGWAGLEVDDESWSVKVHHTNSAWGHHFQRPPKPEQSK